MDGRCIPAPASSIWIEATNRLTRIGWMLEISDGIISKETWAVKCKALGIEGIPLVIAAESASAAKQETLPFG